jgi:tetratricopeptide (TPR) repeat protein
MLNCGLLKSRGIISVFIASPGDLTEERQRFHKAILEINHLKAAQMNLQLEPLGWEDTLPGKGRPQALINREIEGCDLFVLLLWKRWGTPTGTHSSGTEEEFELASRLSEQTGSRPAIWLYFKKVPDDMMADPGKQLQSVLAFRSRIETERSFLYRSFDTADAWEDMFKGHLARWLDDLPPFQPAPKRVAVSSEHIDRLQRSAASQNQPSTAQEKLANVATDLRLKAVEASRAGRFTEAESFFASSLATYEDPETLNAYGLFLDGLGDLAKAQELFERLVVLSRDTEERGFLATAYANLGHIFSKRSNIEKAAKFWKLAADAAGINTTVFTEVVTSRDAAIQYYSCFISYSDKDQQFADRLYSDLQANGVRCWFAPHQLQAGKKIHEQIDEAIRLYDKILLILSEHSIDSQWVATEIAQARSRESKGGVRVLFPVRIVSFEVLKNWKMFDADLGRDSARIVREYYIPDFSNWMNPAAYQAQFKRLLADLKAESSTGVPPEGKAH